MYVFCSKALADALNFKKNELQRMADERKIDELYAWHGHIMKLNGKNTIILMNDKTMYSLILRNRLPKNVETFAILIKKAIPYTMEVGGFNNPEIRNYMDGIGEIVFAIKPDRQMNANISRMFLDLPYTGQGWQEDESVQAEQAAIENNLLRSKNGNYIKPFEEMLDVILVE